MQFREYLSASERGEFIAKRRGIGPMSNDARALRLVFGRGRNERLLGGAVRSGNHGVLEQHRSRGTLKPRFFRLRARFSGAFLIPQEESRQVTDAEVLIHTPIKRIPAADIDRKWFLRRETDDRCW
jgi:hypothetical protein